MRIAAVFPSAPSEFHFTDVYNRRGAWKNLPAGKNLNLLEVFAKLYRHYRWRVFVQTVDDYTLRDHPELGDLPGFGELAPKENRADLSLLLLCLQIRIAYKTTRPAIQLFVDQGLRRPQKPFGEKLFSDWTGGYFGKFESSATEPLLQIGLRRVLHQLLHLPCHEAATFESRSSISRNAQFHADQLRST